VTREQLVQERIISFVQVVCHEMAVPLLWCIVRAPVFFRESRDFTVEKFPPHHGFFFVNEIANKVWLTKAVQADFVTLADSFEECFKSEVTISVILSVHRISLNWIVCCWQIETANHRSQLSVNKFSLKSPDFFSPQI
jgi:hypothetical protein